MGWRNQYSFVCFENRDIFERLQWDYYYLLFGGQYDDPRSSLANNRHLHYLGAYF